MKKINGLSVRNVEGGNAKPKENLIETTSPKSSEY